MWPPAPRGGLRCTMGVHQKGKKKDFKPLFFFFFFSLNNEKRALPPLVSWKLKNKIVLLIDVGALVLVGWVRWLPDGSLGARINGSGMVCSPVDATFNDSIVGLGDG